MLVILRKFRLIKEISATSKNSNLFFIQEFLVSCKFKLSIISKMLPHRDLCVFYLRLFKLEFEMQLLKTEDFDLLDASTVFRGFHSGWSEGRVPSSNTNQSELLLRSCRNNPRSPVQFSSAFLQSYYTSSQNAINSLRFSKCCTPG